MKTVVRILCISIAVAAIPIYVWYCHWDGVYEGHHDLGHSFRLIMRGQKSASSFESLAHYSYLWSGRHNLGRVDSGTVSVSPSGRYAAYVHDNGAISLYDAKSGKVSTLSRSFVGLPEEYTWNELAGIVTVKFYDKHPIKTYNIPE